MKVWVEKARCTGCAHCHDVCPVAVFEMKDRTGSDVNSDPAPPEHQWQGKTNEEVYNKWKDVQDGHRHFADKYENGSGGISVAVNSDACILCQACLIECEGECITIIDDAGAEYHSIYK